MIRSSLQRFLVLRHRFAPIGALLFIVIFAGIFYLLNRVGADVQCIDTTDPNLPYHCDDLRKQQEHTAFLNLFPVSQTTHTAKTNTEAGISADAYLNWEDTTTWAGNQVPGTDAKVVIPVGSKVKINQENTPKIKTVFVSGTLEFNPEANTMLKVETLGINVGGSLYIGHKATTTTPEVRVNETKIAKIIFANNGDIDRTYDPTMLSRGLISHGTAQIIGAEKTGFHPLESHLAVGATSLTLADDPQNSMVGWKVGDQILIPGTVSPDTNVPDQSEIMEITSISGRTINFDKPGTATGGLTYDHKPPQQYSGELKTYVGDLTRNIQFSSELASDGTPPPASARGHVMFMHSRAVEVKYVSFNYLGRTDKKIPLDDAGPDKPAVSLNPRGRYALHFHRTGGLDKLSIPVQVKGNVVTNNPGWGYVNHASNVDMIDNIAYNIDGAAFNVEVGNEMGTFQHNLAVKLNGFKFPKDDGTLAQLIFPTNNGTTPDEINQQVYGRGYDTFVNHINTRHERNDKAFTGMGFWVEGPLVRLKDNVVSGAQDYAYEIQRFDQTGAFAEGIDNYNAGRSVEPNPANIGPEFNIDPAHPLTSVPMYMKGNTVYASRVGINAWGINFGEMGREVFKEAPLANWSQILDTTMWNVRGGHLDIDYSSHFHVNNLKVYGATYPNAYLTDGDEGGVYDAIFENMKIVGLNRGIYANAKGRRTIRNSYFDNKVNVSFGLDNPMGGDATMEGLTFGTFNGAKEANYKCTNCNEARAGSEVYVPRILIDGKQVYVNWLQGATSEQPGQNQPIKLSTSVGSYGNDYRINPTPYFPADAVGKTNAQLEADYGLSMGGIPMPSDAITPAGMVDFKLGSKSTKPQLELPPRWINGYRQYNSNGYVPTEVLFKGSYYLQFRDANGKLYTNPTPTDLNNAFNPVTFTLNGQTYKYLIKVRYPNTTKPSLNMSAPTNVQTQTDPEGIKLTWDSNGGSFYAIERSRNNGPFEPLTSGNYSVQAPQSNPTIIWDTSKPKSFIDTTTESGQNYKYRIRLGAFTKEDYQNDGNPDNNSDSGVDYSPFSNVTEPIGGNPGGGSGVTAPSVSILSPANGTTIAPGSTTISANASDDGQVVSVQFKIDGVNFGNPATSPGSNGKYSIAWNPTARLSDYQITAVATDNANPAQSTESAAVGVTVSDTLKTVTISDNQFTPASLQINVGDTVVWTNNGSVSHTVTSNTTGATFNGNLAPNGTFSYTFTQAGTVNYVCTIHAGMAGQIIVGTPTNTRPTVTLTAPASVNLGQSITLSATANDPDGTITKVEFFDGTTPLKTVTSSPYSFDWTGASLGTHTVKAVATDNGNPALTGTDTKTVTVNDTPQTGTACLTIIRSNGLTAVTVPTNVTLYKVGQANPFVTKTNLTPDSSGKIQFTDPALTQSVIDTTQFDILIQAQGFLIRKYANKSLTSCITPTQPEALVVGDFNSPSDNVITSADFPFILGAYLNKTPAEYYQTAKAAFGGTVTSNSLASFLYNYQHVAQGDGR